MTTAGLNVLSCCAPTTARPTTLRATRAADLDRAHALLEHASLPIDGVGDHFETGYVVAEQNGRLIGLAGIEIYEGDALLRSVAVDAAHRDRGLGITLVQDRLRWAREQNIRDVYLLTTTAADFFTRLGFTQIERTAAPPALQRAPEFTSICDSTATTMRLSLADGADVRAFVRERYADAARAAAKGEKGSCCGDSKARPWNPITSNLYEEGETGGLPVAAMLASLGCGNPTALAQLDPGETVLDLGSGGGIDVLLSAKRVGPTGKAYGLDMTDEMLALARENQVKAGATNVEFLKGEIENIPLPDNSVDVIISNCVINLSADKARVLREAFRVLKPGGRFAVSDIVVRGHMPEVIRRNVELWTGCVAGALEESEYERLLREAGFADATVEPTRIYGLDDVVALSSDAGLQLTDSAARELDARFMSAFVRARKPA
jgi:N-acetylglutamate synthase-like GNAT family acetyltransferase/SAM-dependent methyltransferase